MSDEPQATDTPWRRSTSEIHDRLNSWARATFGSTAAVTAVDTPENGMSSETMLFTVDDGGARHDLVARLAPMDDAFPVFPTYDLALQVRCMRLVGEHTTAPVPEVVAHETDPSYLGSEFVVMRRVSGIVPTDNPPYVFGGWLLDAGVDERAALQRSSIEVLARIHALTPATHDLSFLTMPDRGASAMDQQLAYQHWYYDWARGDVRYPLIEALFDWIEARRPPEGPPVLNWGDARIGNMLYRDFSPVAVLDWEMATVGPAEVDLAWMIFLHSFFQSIADVFGLPGVPGFMRRDEVAATYAELTGRPVEALDWYEAYAALRFASISIRTSLRGVHYGLAEPPADPDSVIMHRALIEQMLDGTYWNGR